VTCFRKVGDVIIAVGYYISHATSEQARTLLDRASEAVRTDPQKAFVEFNKLHGKYSEDDLYVFVVDMTDNQFMAHGINHRLIGKDAMALRDTTGKAVLKEMFAALNDKDSAEIDYVWPNPLTKKIENKHTMVRKVSNYLVGVGYYTR
jgi:cytochrome c